MRKTCGVFLLDKHTPAALPACSLPSQEWIYRQYSGSFITPIRFEYCIIAPMKWLKAALFTLFLLGAGQWCTAQLIEEDTSTASPFFAAKKFDSKGYVGAEAIGGQILKKKGGMLTGLSLNWVMNHKYVLSAKYHVLSSRQNIAYITHPDNVNAEHNLVHHFAGAGFGYILFHNKPVSFHPELAVGWASAKYENGAQKTFRNDYAMLIPALQGVWNATKIFRVGVGVNYRVAFGKEFQSFKSSQLNGVSGVVFLRLGTF